MSQITNPFHGLATELHMTSAIGGVIDATTKVAEVAAIGTLELTANIIAYNSYGRAFKQKLVGQKDSGTLALTLNWVAGETSHQVLKDRYDDGGIQTFAIRWIAGAENATAEFTGYIASFSIDTPVEDIVSSAVEIAIDEGVTFAMDTV